MSKHVESPSGILCTVSMKSMQVVEMCSKCQSLWSLFNVFVELFSRSDLDRWPDELKTSTWVEGPSGNVSLNPFRKIMNAVRNYCTCWSFFWSDIDLWPDELKMSTYVEGPSGDHCVYCQVEIHEGCRRFWLGYNFLLFFSKYTSNLDLWPDDQKISTYVEGPSGNPWKL